MVTHLLFIALASGVAGYIIGSLCEKWKYFKKTGKHLQDLK